MYNGFHFEQCSHYHVQVTLLSLLSLCQMKTIGRDVEQSVRETIRQALSVMEECILPDGSFPIMGDNCFPFFHATLAEDVDNALSLGKYLFHRESRGKKIPHTTEIRNQYIISS